MNPLSPGSSQQFEDFVKEILQTAPLAPDSSGILDSIPEDRPVVAGHPFIEDISLTESRSASVEPMPVAMEPIQPPPSWVERLVQMVKSILNRIWIRPFHF